MRHSARVRLKSQTRRCVLGTTLLLFGLPTSVRAQAIDCTKLMAYGIYDQYNVLSARQEAAHASAFVDALDSESWQRLESSSAGGGFSIAGIGANAGSDNRHQDASAKLHTLSRKDQSDLATSSTDVAALTLISTAITGLVSHCIDSQTNGLFAYVKPHEDRHGFDFFVRYKNDGNVVIPIREIDLVPAALKDTSPAARRCTAGLDLLRHDMAISNAAGTFTCTLRPTDSWPVTIEMTTGAGPVKLTFDLSEAPAPTRRAFPLESLDGRYTGYVTRLAEFDYLIGQAEGTSIGPNVAGFALRVPAGRYDVLAEYAAASRRPMALYVNLPPDAVICPAPQNVVPTLASILETPTGGEMRSDVKPFTVGTIDLADRTNVLQFIRCEGNMPHVLRFTLLERRDTR